MTPYEIGILLHIHAIAVDHPHSVEEPSPTAPIYKPTIDGFLAQKLIEPDQVRRLNIDDGSICTRSFKLTERGECYVGALQKLPLPEVRWVVPMSDPYDHA